jgi:HAD superfamily hydrolase (TIGR01509 family)
MVMIKAVVFDVGGVLAYDVWEHLLCDPPGSEPTSVAAMLNLPRAKVWEVGKSLWKDYECQSTRSDERKYWEKFKQQLSEFPVLQHLPSSFFIDMTDGFIREVQGMVSLLTELDTLQSEKKIQLGICSNNNAFWFHRQMTNLGLHRFFKKRNRFLSFQAGCPKPDLFGVVLKGLGIAGHECIFVDDRPSNVQAAVEQYGMAGILFPIEHRKEGAGYLRSLLRQKGISI